MKQDIKLGTKVKCIHTGFTGIAVSKTDYINGCVQYEIVPKITKDNKYPDSVCLDSQSLEIISPKPKPKAKKETGGPTRTGMKMRGY